jgi:hypothetical protein
MNKNATIHTRKNAKHDRLQGAPGHLASPDFEAPTSERSKVPAMKFVPTTARPAAKQDADSSHSTLAEGIIQSLGSVFGVESMQKWRDLLNANSAEAQAAFCGILRHSLPNLPENFSLEDIAKLTDKPTQTIRKHPVASAATVAASVGAFFLVRELVSGNTNSTAKKLVKSARASLDKTAAQAKPPTSRKLSAKKKSAVSVKAKRSQTRGKSARKTTTKKSKLS